MDGIKLHTSEFVSSEEKGRRYFASGRSRRNAARRQKDDGLTGMLVKIGVCAAAFALVLAVKAVSDRNAAVAASAGVEEGGFDEGMGRLQFVELPGIIEVFSPGDKYVLRCDAAAYEELVEDTLLCLTMDSDQVISAPAACTVKQVYDDAELGRAVSLITPKDEELIYQGLSAVLVEEGQLLSAGDDLGTVAEGGMLVVKANVSGSPTAPLELFDLQTEAPI